VTDREGLRRIDLAEGTSTVVARAKECAVLTESLIGEPDSRAPPATSVVVSSDRTIYFLGQQHCFGGPDPAHAWGVYRYDDDAVKTSSSSELEYAISPDEQPVALSTADGRLLWTAGTGLDDTLGYVAGRIYVDGTLLLDELPSPRYLAKSVVASTGSLYVVCEKPFLEEAQIVRVDVPRALDALGSLTASTYDKSDFDSVVSKADAGYPSAVGAAPGELYYVDAHSRTLRVQPIDAATGLPSATATWWAAAAADLLFEDPKGLDVLLIVGD